MSSYFTFAITLTVAYIIYYAVNIVRDLYGKKGDGKTEEETFDLGPVDTTEESIDVSENETGFSVGGEKYDTDTETAAAPETSDGDKEEEEAAQTRFERLKAKAEARMEAGHPYLSDAFAAEDLYKAMISKGRLENRPELEWKPVKDKL